MGKINPTHSGYTLPEPPKGSLTYWVKKIFQLMCERKGIESATLEGCWYEISTGDEVSIESIRDEEGVFLSYDIHKAGGTPVNVSDLSDYKKCPDSLFVGTC